MPLGYLVSNLFSRGSSPSSPFSFSKHLGDLLLPLGDLQRYSLSSERQNKMDEVNGGYELSWIIS